MNYWLSCVISAYLIQICFDSAQGHVRFVCPRPQSARSDIFEQWPDKLLDGPCGLGDDMNFEAEYMEVEPGPVTVVFEETVFHKDSPFRISLHEFRKDNTSSSDASSCVLLDQIPHNNKAIVTDHCKMTGYPIGHCDGSKYSITIKIPDIQCEKCYLKLAFIIMDEVHDKTCGGENSTCKTYYSCANIKIRSSPAGEHLNISSCGNYLDNLLGPWPRRPQEIYKVNKPMGGKEYLAEGNYDPYMKKLHIDVPVKAGNRESIQRIAVIHLNEVGNDTLQEPLFSHNVTQDDYVGDTVVTVWSGISAGNEILLKNNSFTVVVTSKYGEINGTLEFIKGYNTLGVYSPQNDFYSRDGWLAGRDFMGSMATFPAVIEPVGSCTQAPHNYVAFLHLYGLVSNFHGVVAMSFVDHQVHVTAAIHGVEKPIQSIHAVGPDLGGAPSFYITNSSSDSPVLYMVANSSSQMPYIGSVRFLKTAIVRTLDMLIDGELEQGMQCVLRANNKVHGVGGFQFTKGRWLTFEILVKDPDSDIKAVTLDGPENWTVNGPTMYSLTNDVTNLKNGQWLVKGTLKDLSSEFLLALWKGWVTVTVKTLKGIIAGMLSSPGIWYCTQLKGAPCPLVNLLPIDTVFVDEGAEVVPPMGLGAFILDRADVLQYSILVENLPMKAVSSLMAKLVIMETNISISVELHPYKNRDKAYKSHGISPESVPEVINALAAGKFRLVIAGPMVGKKPFNVSLPSITRELCTSPKNHYIGGSDGWSVGKKLSTVYGLVYDSLVFRYSSNDSVYLMESKEAYDNCSFKGASMIGASADNITTETYRLSSNARLYFASMLNCNATPPLKVEVVSVPGVAPQTADLDECGISLFEIWRKQKLSKFTPPNPMGAAIGGVIAGLVVLAVFIMWDRRVNQKKSGNLALFERF